MSVAQCEGCKVQASTAQDPTPSQEPSALSDACPREAFGVRELAPAFARVEPSKSAGKPDPLQRLRPVLSAGNRAGQKPSVKWASERKDVGKVRKSAEKIKTVPPAGSTTKNNPYIQIGQL
jgi:hypothetical protein